MRPRPPAATVTSPQAVEVEPQADVQPGTAVATLRATLLDLPRVERDALASALRGEGCQVALVADVQAALDADSEPPDLLLADQALAEELEDRLRASGLAERVVLLLVGSPPAGGAGLAVEVLRRPLEAADAQRRLKVHLAYARRLRALDAQVRSDARSFDSSPTGICLTSPTGVWLQVNETLCRMLDRPREELLGRHFNDVTHPEDRWMGAGTMGRLLSGESRLERLEKRYLTRGGEVVHVELYVALLRDEGGQPQHFVVHVVDVGERRRARQELEESEASLRALLENTEDYVLFSNDRGEPVFYNAAYARVMREVLGLEMAPGIKPHESLADPAERAFWDECHRRVLGGERFQFEYPIAGRWLEVRYNPVLQSGRVTGFSEFTRDITTEKRAKEELEQAHAELESRVAARTLELLEANRALSAEVAERQRAEEALRESQAKWRSLVASSPERILLLDRDGRVLFSNRLTGADGAAGHGPSGAADMLPPDALQLVAERCPQVARTGRTLTDTIEWRTGCGEERALELRLAPIFGTDGVTGFTCRLTDVTEQQARQRELAAEQLKRAKLESLGTLAGGIAHDFNNYLCGIVGSLSLAQVALARGDVGQALEALERALGGCQQSQRLTQQFLTFSRGGVLAKRVVSLREVIQRGLTLSSPRAGVTRECDVADDLWDLEGDEGQLDQVLHNLLINSEQAMPAGGRVFLQARNVVVAAGGPLPLQPGPYVRLSVSDQGVGIPPRDLPRIFDPYFTTKQRGNGLGLATVQSVVDRHGGHIRADSTPGVGTTFCLHLPAAAEVDERPPAAAEVRVLVVDDEEIVRGVLVAMLRSLGYAVEAVDEGGLALTAFAAARGEARPFSLVLLDLATRRGPGGLETLQRLRELHGDVCAVAISGYSQHPVMADCTRFGFRAALSKPFELAELRRVLDAALAAGSS